MHNFRTTDKIYAYVKKASTDQYLPLPLLEKDKEEIEEVYKTEIQSDRFPAVS